MNDLYLVFIAGLLGSAHCIGMCGGFVLAINTTQDRSSNLLHQALYFGGKTLTYTIMGALAGAFGSALVQITGLQNVLSIIAGVAMLAIGLGLIGVFDRLHAFGRLTNVPAFRKAMGYFLKQRSFSGTFGLGLINGLLPCGLVYGLLVKAASTGTLAGGALTMMVFGIATIPALFALGLGGHLLRPAWRSRLNMASGVIVILMGCFTVIRGTPARAAVMGAIMGGSHHGATHEMHEPAPPDHSTHPDAHPLQLPPEH